jgi:hypothetical protein
MAIFGVVLTQADVETARAKMNLAYSDVLNMSQRATTAGTNTPAQETRVASLSEEVKAINAASTFWGFYFNEIVARAEAATLMAFNIATELATLLGEKNPVTLPDSPWVMGDYLKWGLILGGSYLLYKWVVQLAPTEYPRDQLPAYAGGKKRR